MLINNVEGLFHPSNLRTKKRLKLSNNKKLNFSFSLILNTVHDRFYYNFIGFIQLRNLMLKLTEFSHNGSAFKSFIDNSTFLCFNGKYLYKLIKENSGFESIKKFEFQNT